MITVSSLLKAQTNNNDWMRTIIENMYKKKKLVFLLCQLSLKNV